MFDVCGLKHDRDDVVISLGVVEDLADPASFPCSAEPLFGNFFAVEAALVRLCADSYAEVRVLELLEHPGWPSLWRRGFEEVDVAINALAA